MPDQDKDVIIALLIELLSGSGWCPDYADDYAIYEQLPQTVRMKIDNNNSYGYLDSYRQDIAGGHGYDPLSARMRERFGIEPLEGVLAHDEN